MKTAVVTLAIVLFGPLAAAQACDAPSGRSMTALHLLEPESAVVPASETRPGNVARNHRIPHPAELRRWRRLAADWPMPAAYAQRVNGRFAGTTDEILQWGAAKWGFDPNVVRAHAWVESSHDMDTEGDGGVSFGLLQVKSTLAPGSAPLTRLSTAFGVDLGLAILRTYYDGLVSWMYDKSAAYAPGDLWGSLGAYYSGAWHTADSLWYQQKVCTALRDRAWETP
jgi:hypothetical protein